MILIQNPKPRRDFLKGVPGKPAKIILTLCLLSMIALVLSGSGTRKTFLFGKPITEDKITAIAALFDHPDRFNGRTVTLSGIVDEQDERGAWFYLQDDEARVYVDLYEAGFAIPQLPGKRVLVQGNVEVKMGIPSLLATGIEMK